MYGVFTTPISHERPPRLNDHFLAYKGVVVQARDYCTPHFAACRYAEVGQGYRYTLVCTGMKQNAGSNDCFNVCSVSWQWCMIFFHMLD